MIFESFFSFNQIQSMLYFSYLAGISCHNTLHVHLHLRSLNEFAQCFKEQANQPRALSLRRLGVVGRCSLKDRKSHGSYETGEDLENV